MIATRRIKNLEEMKKLGEFLMFFLHPSTYLILQGKLGVGKTTLVQLIAKKLQINSKVVSPTFSILKRYQIKDNYYLNHFDFFRLNFQDDLDFFSELTFNNLNIIEWGENNLRFWQEKKYLKIDLSKENNSEVRRIFFFIPYSLSFAQEIIISQFFSHADLSLFLTRS